MKTRPTKKSQRRAVLEFQPNGNACSHCRAPLTRGRPTHYAPGVGFVGCGTPQTPAKRPDTSRPARSGAMRRRSFPPTPALPRDNPKKDPGARRFRPGDPMGLPGICYGGRVVRSDGAVITCRRHPAPLYNPQHGRGRVEALARAEAVSIKAAWRIVKNRHNP